MRTPVELVWSRPTGCLLLALVAGRSLRSGFTRSRGGPPCHRSTQPARCRRGAVERRRRPDLAVDGRLRGDHAGLHRARPRRQRRSDGACPGNGQPDRAAGARARLRGDDRRRRLRVPVGHRPIELPGARVRGGILRRRQADAHPAAPARRVVEDAPDDDRPGSRRVGKARGGLSERLQQTLLGRHASTTTAPFVHASGGRAVLPALIAARDRWRTQGSSSKAESCFRRSSTTPSGSATIPERSTTRARLKQIDRTAAASMNNPAARLAGYQTSSDSRVFGVLKPYAPLGGTLSRIMGMDSARISNGTT